MIKFLNITKKEAILSIVVAIVVATLGVVGPFIGLLAMNTMAIGAYYLSKCPYRHTKKVMVMTVGCIMVAAAGGVLLAVSAGTTTLAGAGAGLTGTLLVKNFN